ncbi:hypothetical protein ABZ357_04355 [Streptomyces sp. NPDC005917]|uniref:hypothetical protein n=1 Tax=unclassified Streptomyces TaxID=2593676 RepID=UPI0033D3DAD8
MPRQKKNQDGGPVNTYGIGSGGGALFDRMPWTPWKSVIVGLVGVAGICLGVGYGSG